MRSFYIRKEIANIGMISNMICSRCGKTINDEAVICPKCGEFTEKGALKLQEAAKQGSVVKDNFNFTKTNLRKQ